MTPAERKELARKLSAAIRAGDLHEVQRLLDIADSEPDKQTGRDEAQPVESGAAR